MALLAMFDYTEGRAHCVELGRHRKSLQKPQLILIIFIFYGLALQLCSLAGTYNELFVLHGYTTTSLFSEEKNALVSA
jgi:hypothetical protein